MPTILQVGRIVFTFFAMNEMSHPIFMSKLIEIMSNIGLIHFSGSDLGFRPPELTRIQEIVVEDQDQFLEV
jgi:hypothetical protein